MTPSPLFIDHAGQVRLRWQHERSGLAKSYLIMPTPRFSIFSCSGSGEEYEIEQEEIGSSPNLMICDLVYEMQKQSDIDLRQSESDSRNSDIARTKIHFVSKILEISAKPLLNCKADLSKSQRLCLEFKRSIDEINSGSLASTQVERLTPILSELPCVEQADAA
jgi:hypothetical protein